MLNEDIRLMLWPIYRIKPNPDNPRIIKDDEFHKLVKSLKDFPEMADVRPIVINQDNIILGGNMRFRAMKEAGYTECPVIQVNWPEDKQREFVIKDNLSHGEWDWDELGNNWDAEELKEWGMNVWQSEEQSEEDDSTNFDGNSGFSLIIQFNSEEEAQRSHSLIAQALSGFGIPAKITQR